jgi:hypothetical protein
MYLVPLRKSRKIILFAAICSILCMVLTAIGMIVTEFAYAQHGPVDQVGSSMDTALVLGAWSFILYDLFHLIVLCVFLAWLPSKSFVLSMLGIGFLIFSSLADALAVALNATLSSQTLKSVMLGNGLGSVLPMNGYDIVYPAILSTQEWAGLIGYACLIHPILKSKDAIRVAGLFVLIGFPLGILQVIEANQHTPFSFILDTWITPIVELLQHGAIAGYFLMLLSIWKRDAGPHSPANSNPPNLTDNSIRFQSGR